MIEISTDEIVEVMSQLYPDQLSRAIAEIKAKKYEALYLEASQPQEDEDGPDQA